MLTDRLQNYAQLMRLDRPIGTFLLLWPTLWAIWIAAAGRPSIKVLIVFVLGVFIMRSAGCVINDYADREFDPHVKGPGIARLRRAASSPGRRLFCSPCCVVLPSCSC